MRFDGNWGKAAWTALVVLLSACGSNTTSAPQDPAVGTASAPLWGCDANGTRVTCTTAIAEAKEQVAAAYACKANQSAATCPDAAALRNVPGLGELLARTGASSAFANMTWACLVTGKQQYQCVRDVANTVVGNGGPSGGDGTPTTPGTPPGTPGVPSTGGNGDGPAVPGSCDPSAWEPYFAALATYEYGAHGVKLTFPASIFHATAPLDTTGAAEAAQTHNVGVPSCHDGEWAMRDKSWLDAVQHGCEGLNNAITVMCQQGANYAPLQGACSDTGAW